MKIRWFVFKKYLFMMMDPRWCNGVPSAAAGGPGLGFLALLRSRPHPLSPRSSSSSSCHRRQWKLTATNPLARHPASPPPPQPPLILVNQSRQVARSLFRNITSAILKRNLSSWLCPVSSSILRPLSLLSATTTKSILHSQSTSSPASPRFTSLTFSSTNSQTPRRNQTPSPPPLRPQPNGFGLSRVRVAGNPNPNRL